MSLINNVVDGYCEKTDFNLIHSRSVKGNNKQILNNTSIPLQAAGRLGVTELNSYISRSVV